MSLVCKCGSDRIEARPHELHTAGAWCRACGGFVKWLGRIEGDKMLRAQKAFGQNPVQPALLEEESPEEAARARIAAILDGQAKRDPIKRNIERMKRDERIEDPFA